MLSTIRSMLALAWRIDARLTLAYFLTALFAALAPLASAFFLKLVIDHVAVTSVAAYFAIGALTAAIHYGLHSQFYDYLLRYKLQDAFTYRFCEKLTQLDVPHLENAEVQALITKVRDTHAWRLPDFFRSLANAFLAVIGVVSATIALAPFGWWIVPVVIAATLPRLYLRARFGEMRWSMYGSGAPEARKLWYFGTLLSDTSALRELKVFRTAAPLLARYREIQARIFTLGRRPLDRYRRVGMLAPLLEGAAVFSVAWNMLPEVSAGAITIGSFAFFLAMLQQLATMSAECGVGLGWVYEESLHVKNWNALMAVPRVITEAPSPVTFPMVAPPRIEFRHVTFAYPSGRVALDDVSFTIEPGESLALVGANGAGKSTVIKLLCRFYDVTSGQILVNGVDLRELDLQHWYAHLGTLFQDFVQYKLTVRDNVMLGDPSRVDEQAMREAVRKAGAAELVASLPRGYDTVLGTEFEDGEQLSGGQWQKLAIARAFYQGAPVLIMDEPTSAIDAEAEREIFENLEHEYRDRTLVLVSHRFSTVRNADRILVIDGGRIAEQGTHDELVAAGGRYAGMFRAQAQGYVA